MTDFDLSAAKPASALTVVLDPKGRIAYWNPACSALSGYTLEEVRGRRFWDVLLPPEQVERTRAAFALVLAGEPLERFENEWLTREGKRCPLAWSAATLMGSHRHVEHVVGSAVQITERARIEEALRRSRDDLRLYERAIFENTFQFVGLLAPDGILLEANPSALEFAGAQLDDVVGKAFWETPWWQGHPDAQDRLKAGIGDAARGQFVRFETRHSGAGGRLAIIDFSLTPVKDETGRVVLLVPEGRDITERKRAEARQQFLADATGIIALGKGHRDPLADVAKRAVPLLADCCIVARVDDEGRMRRIEVVHAATPRPWFADVLERFPSGLGLPALSSALETGRPVLLADVAPLEPGPSAPDGEHLRALQALDARSAMAVPLDFGEGILGAFLFISSRPGIRYEPDDLHVAQSVAQRAATAIENSILYAKARDAIEARDRVLAIVAHDLRNPLNAALMAARTLLGEGSEQARRAADRIQRSLALASRLIQDLLDVAQIESGHLALERSRVPADDLVTEAADAWGQAALDASLTLDIDVQPGLPRVAVDLERMLQVFSNLIGNAVKFTPAGGTIRIVARRGDDHVRFSVTDSGPGIPSDHLTHLFDRFWRARPGDRRGIGQGLAIAKGIVEAHGGRIWVESGGGNGTTFHFTVPASLAPGDRSGG